METIEIMVYLGVALALGVMILQFLTTWDYHKVFDGVTRLMTKERTIEFKTVDIDGFVADLFNLWENCGFGEVDKAQTLYVDDAGPLTKSTIFQKIKKLNLCDSLQSASSQCGRAEHMPDFGVIDLPHVVRMECDSVTETLVLRGG